MFGRAGRGGDGSGDGGGVVPSPPLGHIACRCPARPLHARGMFTESFTTFLWTEREPNEGKY